MATLALSFAGQAIGGFLGGPLGATLGRAVGALAGNAIDQALFSDQPLQRGADIRLQGSQEGIAIPRVYGWSRLAGNVIWATELERVSSQSSGSKGVSSPAGDEIIANFAIALCEGEVAHLGRIWADGRVLETEGLGLRFYAGAQTQMPDSLIMAKQGAGRTPAFRGTCYLVFEGLPLGEFGNRIPNISVEICRVVGELEPNISAITIIPGATEFGYDPQPRVRIASPGVTIPENAHAYQDASDWTVSLDELQALCPNLKHVALVVSWFGDDLRCGQCRIEPRVESASRNVAGVSWVVGGIARSAATPVSTVNGAPAYGGTPSDASVLAAIADLKARGLGVTLYPFLLMDVPGGNILPDPYTLSAGQPAYPWRGRMTCDPAPGIAGSVDQTAAAAAQTSIFAGLAAPGDFTIAATTVTYAGPNEWSYRRLVLHYAHLCQAAGGVHAFLIGSELRGLTQVRSAPEAFPFVAELVSLAADVRSILGPATKITYGADWSEYSGYQPADAPGDKLFHLDPLWASADIDAVGIDNYMPLSDWRDGDSHADAAAGSIYAPDYLGANIAGGDGFDWYYASDGDRQDQIRTPIADGAYAEPWIWRHKDLVSWWSNAHFNRVAGVRAALPTSWQAEAKPIWFTELGCGAVDKGANLPSAFADPKSGESTLPYFSSGAPDMLMQRQFLRAHFDHWLSGAPGFDENWNPVSTQYAGRMVDAERLYLWTWDARPFPQFPQLGSVWADGANHATGHWLTGRLGGMASDELLKAMAADWQVPLASADAAHPAILGTTISNVTSFRSASESLVAGSGLSIRDREDGVHVLATSSAGIVGLTPDELVGDDAPLQTAKRQARGEVPRQFVFGYDDRIREYSRASVAAVGLDGVAEAGLDSTLVLDMPAAATMASNLLNQSRLNEDSAGFAVPRSKLSLEVGDRIMVANDPGVTVIVTQIRDGADRRIMARPEVRPSPASLLFDQRSTIATGAAATALPELHVAHLPPDPATGGATRLVFGAYAQPWPGSIRIVSSTNGSDLATLTRAATLGQLTAPLAAAIIPIWDGANALELALYGGHLASATRLETLNGANRLLVELEDGDWELLGFETAELIGGQLYRLRGLLRGLQATGGGGAGAAIGAKAMLVDSSLAQHDLNTGQLGIPFVLKALSGTKDASGTTISATTDVTLAQPLAPAHLRAKRDPATGNIRFGWTRRSRLGGDAWALADMPLDFAPEAYRLTIFDGSNPVRTVSAGTPNLDYTAAEQIVDFGGPPLALSYTIAQISAEFGTGRAATGEFND